MAIGFTSVESAWRARVLQQQLVDMRTAQEMNTSEACITWHLDEDFNALEECLERLVLEPGNVYFGRTSSPQWRFRGDATNTHSLVPHGNLYGHMVVLFAGPFPQAVELEERLIEEATKMPRRRATIMNKCRYSVGPIPDPVQFVYCCTTKLPEIFPWGETEYMRVFSESCIKEFEEEGSL